MNATFLILFNLYLVCWLGLYLIFFRKKTWFKMNRFILLSGIFWAIILPLVHFQWAVQNATAISSGEAPSIAVGSGFITTQTNPLVHAAFSFPVWHIIEIIYWLGVVWMFLLFMQRLLRLYLFIKKYPKQAEGDHSRVFTKDHRAIFSFGKYLFAPDDVPDAILRHEIAHIHEKHTLDNLLLEIVKIFCWFNPAVYLYQSVLKDLHEYAADASVTQLYHKSDYARLLTGYAFKVPKVAFTHHFFNRSQLQKRLIMLQKQSFPEKTGRKYLPFIALIAALIIIFASSFTLKNKVNDMISKLSPSGQQLDVKGVVTDQDGNPIARATVIMFNTDKGTITNDQGQFEINNVAEGGLLVVSMVGYSTINVEIKSKKTLHLTLYSKPSRLNQLVVVALTNENTKPVKEKSTGTAFTFVEQMPSFPGGEDALMKFLHDNIRYPQEARKEQLQGTVVVSFVVNKDGSLTQIHTIGQTIGGGLEQEAIRVIKAMPKWIPGHQNGEAEAVPYTLPIRFILQN